MKEVESQKSLKEWLRILVCRSCTSKTPNLGLQHPNLIQVLGKNPFSGPVKVFVTRSYSVPVERSRTKSECGGLDPDPDPSGSKGSYE